MAWRRFAADVCDIAVQLDVTRMSRSVRTRSPPRTPARRACRVRHRRPTCSPASRSPAARSTCRPVLAAALEHALHERGDSHARDLGAGAALCGGDVVPGGVGGVARRVREVTGITIPAPTCAATCGSSASGSTSRSAATTSTSRCCISSSRSTTPPTVSVGRGAGPAEGRARPRDAVPATNSPPRSNAS